MIGTLAVSGVRRSAAADFEPRNALDHPVEQDDVRRRLCGEQQRLLAVGGVRDAEILALEMPFEQVGQRRIVLDQQEPGTIHAGSSPPGAMPVATYWTIEPIATAWSATRSSFWETISRWLAAVIVSGCWVISLTSEVNRPEWKAWTDRPSPSPAPPLRDRGSHTHRAPP